MENRFFTLTLVRHGETLSNRHRIIQGQLDTPLSDVGVEQAKCAGRRLKGEHFTHAFSSDLSRAANTAEQILAQNELSKVQIVHDVRLRERCFGVLEGHPHTDLKKLQDESGLSGHAYTPEGGESLEQVSKRAREFYKYLCAKMAEPIAGSPVDKNITKEENDSLSSDDAPSRRSHNGALADTSNLINESCIPSCCINGNDKESHVTVASAATSATHSRQSSSLSELSIDVKSGIPNASVLVVSHGLLLRELRQVVLNSYKGEISTEAHSISPNTGVTQVTVAVGYAYGKVKVKCVEVHTINDASHLGDFNDTLASSAVFKGAL